MAIELYNIPCLSFPIVWSIAVSLSDLFSLFVLSILTNRTQRHQIHFDQRNAQYLTIDGLQLSVCIRITGDSKNKLMGSLTPRPLAIYPVVPAIRFTPHIPFHL
jgi:hypothetical protein